MPTATIATWNVNSIRAREGHLLDWLRTAAPDVLCLQETKTPDDRFPADVLEQAGYHAAAVGQKSYNGVAILSRDPLEDPQGGFSGDPDTSQARVLSATWGGIRILNVYVPNGSRVGSDKYSYKLAWLEALHGWLVREHDPGEPLLMVGDFNIAPEDRDLYDPEGWRDQVLCSAPERRALQQLFDWGFVDLFRVRQPEPGHYSWWDYRAGRFRRNHGVRIDLILGTEAVAGRVTEVNIDREPRTWPKPSDHTPVVASLEV